MTVRKDTPRKKAPRVSRKKPLAVPAQPPREPGQVDPRIEPLGKR